eukprot:GGOE01061601.1.p1 GENE.GGOE01061601.1~~GGOE01061601.1.p1  ORF type:complete len:396 (+),score=81.34 GGOE01061601.1:33-1190(+)
MATMSAFDPYSTPRCCCTGLHAHHCPSCSPASTSHWFGSQVTGRRLHLMPVLGWATLLVVLPIVLLPLGRGMLALYISPLQQTLGPTRALASGWRPTEALWTQLEDTHRPPSSLPSRLWSPQPKLAEKNHQSSFTTSLMVMVAAVAGSFMIGHLVGGVAMATYQSQFAPGKRRMDVVRLNAVKAGKDNKDKAGKDNKDNADIPKKLDDLKKEAQRKMEAALEVMASKFASVCTGRANPALLDRTRVDCYGSLTPLKQVAGISIPDATTIVITPFDRSTIGAIEKAISTSDLQLTPCNDGHVIRVTIPPLTEDRRQEMVKTVTKMGEEGKVAIRNVRRDILKAADKLKLSENAEDGLKGDVQKITDKFVKKLEEMIAVKEKDLTTV